MRITCPKCGFARSVPEEKVPATSVFATCPKCAHRFRFREVEPADGTLRAERAAATGRTWIEPASQPVPDAARPAPEPRRPSDLDKGTVAPSFSPPPSATWEPEEPPIRPAPRPSAAWEPDPEPEPAPGLVPSQTVAPAAAPPGEPDDEPEPLPRRRHQWADGGNREQRGQEAPEQAPADREAPGMTDETDPAETSRPKARPLRADPDGVRDIWSRLQAMDGGSRDSRLPPEPARPEPEAAPEPQPEAEDQPRVVNNRATRRAVKDDQDGGEGPDAAEAPERDGVPWERLEAYGFFSGLVLTLRRILFQPVDFFESMPLNAGKAKPLVFNILIGEFLLLIDFMWSLLGVHAKFADTGQTGALGAMTGMPHQFGFLLALLLVPFFLAVCAYLDAWLTHALLVLFRSAGGGFSGTFRVVCYSAAPTVLSAVPVAGQLLSPIILIWYMTLQAIGLKKVHGAAYAQTLAAVLFKWSLYLFLFLAAMQSLVPAG